MPPPAHPALARRIAALMTRQVHDKDSSRHLYIAGASPEGRATELALVMNEGGPRGPLGPRHVAIVERRYPPHWARKEYGV